LLTKKADPILCVMWLAWWQSFLYCKECKGNRSAWSLGLYVWCFRRL